MLEDDAVDGLLSQATAELDAAARELAGAVERAESAQRAHRAAEGLADAVLAITERPVIVLDTDLRVVGWSAGAVEAWSMSATDALGRRWSRVARSVDASATVSELEELIAKGVSEAMVPFGESLHASLLGEEGVIQHVLVTPANP